MQRQINGIISFTQSYTPLDNGSQKKNPAWIFPVGFSFLEEIFTQRRGACKEIK